MISVCVHSFGHSFVFQIFWHIAARTVAFFFPPFLSSSEEMPNFGDFTAFRQYTASPLLASAQEGLQALVWGSGYSGVG